MKTNLLVFLVLFLVALFLLLCAVIIVIHTKNKIKRCCQKTMGTIIRYSYLNNGFAPVALYYVQGKTYQVKRKYNGVIRVRKFGKLYSNEETYVSSKDFLHINTAAITNIKSMVERLYPIDSQLPVYYNPYKPKESFLERPPIVLSFVVITFSLCAALLIFIGMIMYLVI